MDFDNYSEDYESKILDINEVTQDVKINPDFYIHYGIIKAQDSLKNPNMKEGFIQYRLFIEHIETIAKSAGLLSPLYEERINEYKKSADFIEEKDFIIKGVLLANKKLEWLLNEVFLRKPETKYMKI